MDSKKVEVKAKHIKNNRTSIIMRALQVLLLDAEVNDDDVIELRFIKKTDGGEILVRSA